MKTSPSPLALRRLKRGLSLEDLSAALRQNCAVMLSATTLHRVEHGRRPLTAAERKALLKVLR